MRTVSVREVEARLYWEASQAVRFPRTAYDAAEELAAIALFSNWERVRCAACRRAFDTVTDEKCDCRQCRPT